MNDFVNISVILIAQPKFSKLEDAASKAADAFRQLPQSVPVVASPSKPPGSDRITRLKGGNNEAQGNALGIADKPTSALKGRYAGT
jgi:hypothetical protein